MAEDMGAYARRVLAGESVEPPAVTSDLADLADLAGLRHLRAALERRRTVLDRLRETADGLVRARPGAGQEAGRSRLDRRA